MLAVVVVMMFGCGNRTLETGYRVRPLGDSEAARRGYYSSPYTPQARAAEMEREQEMDARRPRPGY